MNFNLRTELPTTYRYAVLMSIYILSKGLQYTRMHRYRGPRLLMHAVCAAWGRSTPPMAERPVLLASVLVPSPYLTLSL
jgi:hypothetical protein